MHGQVLVAGGRQPTWVSVWVRRVPRLRAGSQPGRALPSFQPGTLRPLDRTLCPRDAERLMAWISAVPASAVPDERPAAGSHHRRWAPDLLGAVPVVCPPSAHLQSALWASPALSRKGSGQVRLPVNSDPSLYSSQTLQTICRLSLRSAVPNGEQRPRKHWKKQQEDRERPPILLEIFLKTNPQSSVDGVHVFR